MAGGVSARAVNYDLSVLNRRLFFNFVSRHQVNHQMPFASKDLCDHCHAIFKLLVWRETHSLKFLANIRRIVHRRKAQIPLYKHTFYLSVRKIRTNPFT